VSISHHAVPTRDGTTIEATVYRPASVRLTQRLPIYISLHGGGFLFGTSRSEDAACSRVVVNLSPTLAVVVVNINYRHTPEHRYPRAWNDVEDAFDWVHRNLDAIGGDGDQVVVGGISAGGQLAASLVLQQHLGKLGGGASARPRIKGQVLTIPCLVSVDCYEGMLGRMASPDVSSVKENEFAPVLPLSRMRMFTDLLQIERQDAEDRRLNPGYATGHEVQGMPPTVFGIAGLDPLRDEALLYAKHLAENGVPTDVNLFRGVPHGFRRFGDSLSECKHWDSVIANGIRWTLSDPTAASFEIKTE